MHLVAMEISKKQNYIFKSNKLKENIGASLIIKYVTEDLPYRYLEACHGETVFEGGGGSFFKFIDKDNAEKFINKLSLKIMKEYPEIEFFATKIEYENEVDGEKELRKKMADKKLSRSSAFKKISFGVEEICRNSGIPASFIIDDEKTASNRRAVSMDTYKKLNSGKSDKSDSLGIIEIIKRDLEGIKGIKLEEINLKYDFSEFKNGDDRYEFPYDLDNFKKDGNSTLAIVAIDGNGMGSMVDKLKNAFKENQDRYFEKLKEFSLEIDSCYKEAFKKVIEVIVVNKKSEENKEGIEFFENKYLPIRPIILAGDDICYIVESNIALETANIFIKELEILGKVFINKFKNENINLEATKLTACGGVAFVNKKYPFFKGVELAEDLCKNAKARLKKLGKKEVSMIDWHISKGELSNNIKDIRKRYEHTKYFDEKQNKEIIADYNIKPLFISGEYRKQSFEFSYDDFKQMVDEFKKKRTSKLKELINVIPDGKATVDLFLKKYNLEEFFIEVNKAILDIENEYSIFMKKEDNHEIVVYYDVLEIMDSFTELKESENND